MPEATPIAKPVFQLLVTCAVPTPMGQRDGGTAVMIPITGGTLDCLQFATRALRLRGRTPFAWSDIH